MSLHLRDGLNNLYADTCIKVYDPELKKLIGVFPNYRRAGDKLGVSPNSVQNRCASKNRVFSPTYNKEVACRLSRLTPEDKVLIEESSKPGFL